MTADVIEDVWRVVGLAGVDERPDRRHLIVLIVQEYHERHHARPLKQCTDFLCAGAHRMLAERSNLAPGEERPCAAS